MSAVPDRPSTLAGYCLHDIVVSDLVSSTCRASMAEGGDDVALRIVRQRLIDHRRAVDGFLHVSRRVAAIDHPHLLRVIDMGDDDGVPYTASVWRDGMPLSTLLLESAPLEPRDVLRLGGQLAEALDTVHDHGIVHGTVGLPTVWIKRRPESRVAPSAALTAFGSSHLLAPILTELEDAAAAVDLLFIAPEQLRGEPAGPAADQYALACVLFTALTGTTPFRGDTNNELFGSHLFTEPPRVSSVRDDLDPSLDDVFARALAKQPDERFDNCRTLVLAAGRSAYRARRTPVTASSNGRQHVVDTPVAAPAPTGDGSRRRLVRILLAAALLLAVIVVALFGSGAAGVTQSAVIVALSGAARRPTVDRAAPR